MLVGFEGGPCQKIWLQRGVQPENMVCEGVGWSPKKFPLSLVVTASVIMQTSVPEGQQ